MKVIERATMPSGTAIQIEDWHNDYPKVFAPSNTIAAYPKSKSNHHSSFSPKFNETFRASFNFPTALEAKEAFKQLTNGNKKLSDYSFFMWDKKYADCL